MIGGDILCWKNRVYFQKGFTNRNMEAEHDSRDAGYFAQATTMELIARNFS
jgi:hypothetical protein